MNFGEELEMPAGHAAFHDEADFPVRVLFQQALASLPAAQAHRETIVFGRCGSCDSCLILDQKPSNGSGSRAILVSGIRMPGFHFCRYM